MMKKNIKYIGVGVLSSVAFFFLFGIPTALVPTPFFVRMIENTVLDYFFLVMSSALLGGYIAVHIYKKNASKGCDVATYSGGLGGFLAFGCPVCNKILVLLFGTTLLLKYLEPYRPVLGFLSIGVLAGALYLRLRS